MTSIRPRRSVLYMPGANRRAMEKARQLDCDAVILDLEDAVAPAAKDDARRAVLDAVTTGDYGHREVLVRINAIDTAWGPTDLATFADAPIDGIVVPKVEQPDDLALVLETDLPVWTMIETPRGILGLDALLSRVARIPVVVMGTSDLQKELRATDRRGLAYAREHCLMVARAHGREILDGVHLEFRDLASFRTACDEGRALGFDGKTLIHPTQIEPANEAFGVTDAAAAHFREVCRVWDEATSGRSRCRGARRPAG